MEFAAGLFAFLVHQVGQIGQALRDEERDIEGESLGAGGVIAEEPGGVIAEEQGESMLGQRYGFAAGTSAREG